MVRWTSYQLFRFGVSRRASAIRRKPGSILVLDVEDDQYRSHAERGTRWIQLLSKLLRD
jgi:hypothetical protein